MEIDLTEKYKPVKLEYTSFSTSDSTESGRAPIILIHGLFGNVSSWNRVKSEISKMSKRKVYSVTLRNHGESEYTEEFTLKHITSDLLQFMRDQDINRAILFGHSMAGRACIELALLKPEMVEKLVIEDIVISDIPNELIYNLKSMMSGMKKIVSNLPVYMNLNDAHLMVSRFMLKHVVQFAANRVSYDVEKTLLFKKNEKNGSFEFCSNVDVLLKSLDSIHLYSNDLSVATVFPGKALFLKGQYSLMPVEKDKNLILKHFPRAEFSVVKGAFHCIHAENPAEFIRVVTKFLMS
ncbi:sn-1-specific diacylglycerol lipase ABHD11 [Parasteatoda tepidariorum]|nr:protein ABHD11 [Parasteatoda tepidariorum]